MGIIALGKKMFDLEADLGMTWTEIAQSTYEVQEAIAQGRGDEVPNWDSLPEERRIEWECALRSLESLLNDVPIDTDRWQKFALKRLNKRRKK